MFLLAVLLGVFALLFVVRVFIGSKDGIDFLLNTGLIVAGLILLGFLSVVFVCLFLIGRFLYIVW